MSGSIDALENFWGEMVGRRDPRLRYHPMCAQPDWKRRAIPFAVHGDGVAVLFTGRHGARSLDCISIASLVSEGKLSERSLLLSCVFEDNKVHNAPPGTHTTDDAIWAALSWSFQSLFAGEHPRRNLDGSAATSIAAGVPLCSNHEHFFGVLWSIKGDYEWFRKGLQLRSANSNKPCELCEANCAGGPNYWPTNFRADAAWMHTLSTAEGWRAATTRHTLFKEIGYLSCLNLEPDELHVVWLGIAQPVLGAVIWLIVYMRMGGAAAANVDEVWSLVRSKYDVGDSKIGDLSLGTFTNVKHPWTEYPCLKAKGAETKDIVKGVLAAWKQYRIRHAGHAGFPFDCQVEGLLCDLASIGSTLDDHSRDFFLPSNVADSVSATIDSFLTRYTWLAKKSDEQGLLLFPSKPKLHFLWHIARRTNFLNPRRVACWCDESFLSLVKTIAGASARGTCLHNIPTKVMHKHVWALTMESYHDLS